MMEAKVISLARRIVLLTVLALTGVGVIMVLKKAPGAGPNILLVTLDTTRADRLGCYGHGRAKTPTMDALAAEGVRFDLAVAQAAVTPVSHASILTGLYPFQHGLRVVHGARCFRLEEGRQPTLASILQEAGWTTAAFLSAFTVSEYYGLDQGFEVFDNGLDGAADGLMEILPDGRADWGFDRNQRRADATVDRALPWLRACPEPFFLWLHLFDPHDPGVLPPPEFYEPFVAGAADREDATRRLYDAEVAFMDLQLRRVVDLLKESGRYEDTVIVVTSDHGEGLGDHDWWFHRILYGEQLLMPLILRIPGGPSNTVCSDLVRSIDITPTLLECAGIEPPPMSGRSLMGIVRGEKKQGRYAYADALIRLDGNRPARMEARFDDLLYMVMNKRWKLIYHYFDPGASELYRVEDDFGELNNVIGEHPEVYAELLEILRQPGIMLEELIPPAPDSDAARRLEELGYW